MSFSTILWESRSLRPLKSFRNLQWKSSKQAADTPTETLWKVRTNFRLQTFLEYLKLKHFYEGLPVNMQRLLFDAPGVIEDDLFLALLRAKISGVPMDVLETRLQSMQRLLGQSPWEMNLLRTFSGVLSYEISEILKPIRKGKKYSGYVRNSSSVGSKRGFGKSKPEPETFEWNTESTIDYFAYLSVGQLSLASGETSLTLKSPERTKRKPKRK